MEVKLLNKKINFILKSGILKILGFLYAQKSSLKLLLVILHNLVSAKFYTDKNDYIFQLKIIKIFYTYVY